MKPFIVLVLATFPILFGTSGSLAQQAPQAPQERSSGDRPSRYDRDQPEAVPEAPRAVQPSNRELADLLRAQTAAIKSLSGKLDALDDRLKRLEEEAR